MTLPAQLREALLILALLAIQFPILFLIADALRYPNGG